jgi:hypothetical protein
MVPVAGQGRKRIDVICVTRRRLRKIVVARPRPKGFERLPLQA